MFCIYQILLQTGTLQLCDVSFGCEVPTVTKSKKKVSLSPASSLQRSADTNKSNLASASLPPLPPLQTVESSLLPEIQPNYRPNRIPDLMDTPGKKHKGKNNIINFCYHHKKLYSLIMVHYTHSHFKHYLIIIIIVMININNE